jgi:hypothetical protein
MNSLRLSVSEALRQSARMHEPPSTQPEPPQPDPKATTADQAACLQALQPRNRPTGTADRSRPRSRSTERRRHPRTEGPEPAEIVVALVRAGSARHRTPLVLAGHQWARPAHKNRRSHGLRRSRLGRPSSSGPGSSPHPGCCGPPALANKAGITRDGPHPPVQLVTVAVTPEPPFSPAVPPACHKQRSRAVSSGQPRSHREGRWAGCTLLTWGGGGGRNCMACKRSRLDRPCRARPADPVPGRGGPERRRRPRPDGTGALGPRWVRGAPESQGTDGHQRSLAAKQNQGSGGPQVRQLAQRQWPVRLWSRVSMTRGLVVSRTVCHLKDSEARLLLLRAGRLVLSCRVGVHVGVGGEYDAGLEGPVQFRTPEH